jgi:predicted CxxxxCH...CXXCH cytochrome family protein
MVLIPNTSKWYFMYQIISNTADTITVQGVFNTTYIQAGNNFTVVYGQLVKDYVNSMYVRFFRPEGTKSFADGDATYDGICEVCHTQTTYHRNNATGDHTHQAATNCTTCHAHEEGFAGCAGCHGLPPITDVAVAPDGLVWNPSPTGSAEGSAHAKHATGGSNYAYSCPTCHYNGMPVTPVSGNNQIQIGFYLFGGVWTGVGTTYKGQTLNAPYSYEFTNGTVQGAIQFQCTNIYCHGRRPDGSVWGGGASTTPMWNGSVACGDCHKATNADPPTLGSHFKHTKDTAPNLNVACSVCHSTYTSPTVHANNEANISFSTSRASGGTYNGTTTMFDAYGQCSNIYCHSNVQNNGATSGPTTYITSTWGGAVACDDCHGDALAGTGRPTTGSHGKHGTSPYSYICSNCHTNAGSGTTKHADYNIDVSLANIVYGTGTYSQSPNPPANGYGTCSNVYCHSIVQTVTGGPLTGAPSEYKTPTWGETWDRSVSTVCDKCHERRPSSGSHPKHTGNASGQYNRHCNYCHYDDVCGSCHGTPIYSITTSLHANNAINVSAALENGGSYNGDTTPGNGFSNCSNTYCHSNGTGGTLETGETRPIAANTSPTWGGSTTCESCHGGEVLDGSGRPAYSNGSPKANSHSAHSGYLCNKCHVNTSSDGTTITSTANHVNRYYNVNAGAGASFTYAYVVTGGTCSSISCHYNGTATWGTTVACGSCHASPPATGAHVVHFGGTSSEAAYGNDGRITDDPTKYKFNCGNCHPLSASKHGDGTVEIELYNASATGFKQYNPATASRSGTGGTTVCSNVYCHSSGQVASVRTYVNTPQWGSSFTGNKCAGCHGDPPVYANGGAGVDDANSHYVSLGGMGTESAHLVGIHFDSFTVATGGHGYNLGSNMTTISCNICHASTVTANTNTYTNPYAPGTGLFTCSTASCHTAGTTPLQNNLGQIADKTVHINASRDVAFAEINIKSKAQLETLPAGWTRVGGYKVNIDSHDETTSALNTATYTQGTKTCNNVQCHLGGTSVQWGAALNCDSCHTGF